MNCIYGGREYSEGSAICVNGARYICNGGEWRDHGNCFDLRQHDIDRVENSVVGGVSLVTDHGQIYRLVNENKDEKLVTVRVHTPTRVSIGKFYIGGRGTGSSYNVQLFANGEDGVSQITEVVTPPFKGPLDGHEYVRTVHDDKAHWLQNISPHYLYVAVDYGEPKYPWPTSFMRIILHPGRKVPMANGDEQMKIFEWGTVTVQPTLLLA